MADKKISQLTAATTPLAGTEVLPIVQGGSTVKVAVSDLTAGRSISASDITDTSLTASSAVATDANKKLISVTNTGTGNNVLATSPTLVTPILGVASGTSLALGTALDGSVSSVGIAAPSDGNYTDLNKWTPSPVESTTYDLKLKTRFAGAGGDGGWEYSFITRDFFTGSVNYLKFLGGNTVVPTGNLIIGTSGKGIDFSATSNATGMTSELLNDYEEGTWTPTDASGAGLTFTQNNGGVYVKVGKQVTCSLDITFPTTSDTNTARISMPFTNANGAAFCGSLGYSNLGSMVFPTAEKNVATFVFWDLSSNVKTNANLSGKRFVISFSYCSA